MLLGALYDRVGYLPALAVLSFACASEVRPAEPDFDVPESPDAEDDSEPVGTPTFSRAPTPSSVELPASVSGVEEPRAVWCVELATGERLASVSADGHAWLVSEENDSTEFRILDPFVQSLRNTSAEVGSVNTVLARSATEAELITTTGLWRLEDFSRVEISLPDSVSSIASLCGNPNDDGALLASGSLYTVADSLWQRSAFPEPVELQPDRILAREGACFGVDNALWATSSGGALWRIGEFRAERLKVYEAPISAAANADQVLVLDRGDVEVGPDTWTRWIFDDNPPTLVAAGGSAFWLASDTRLLRLEDNTFTELSSPISSGIETLHAHSGGVWVSSADEICHLATQPLVQVASGPKPFSRFIDESINLQVLSDAAIEVSLDGTALSVTEEDGVLAVNADLLAVGWHELQFEVDGDSARVLYLKRLPLTTRGYAADIEPIFSAHCAQCHGVDQDISTPIATYDGWVAFAEQIRERVIESDNMPPAVSRTSAWSAAEVQIIAEWLEGGLLP